MAAGLDALGIVVRTATATGPDAAFCVHDGAEERYIAACYCNLKV
jgi:hypothetical protein